MEHDRILGYFLEEASEHLNTIEQGLRKLPETVKQPQTIRELFRAAHSIKGSAAMLGLLDIQKIGNQFEANFKLLKEQPQIAVDKQLQSLFLESFSFLQAGIEEVRVSKDPYRQDPATPDPVGDPVFEELRSYLQHLLTTGDFRTVPSAIHSRDLDQNTAIEQVFGEYVTRKLDEVLSLFLQPDQPALRTQIQQICQKLGNLGENFEFLEWTNLFTACRLAIANPANTLTQLSESISIAIKQAQVLVLADRPQAIRVTPDLEVLIVGKNSKSTSLGSENLSTWQLTNPHDPVASNGGAPSETTQRLDHIPTQSNDISTQDLSKVEYSNINTSNQLTDSIATDPAAMTADELELDEFMNLLGEDRSAEGTWIEDDNFFNSQVSLQDLGESTTDPFQSQPFASTDTPKSIDPSFDLAQAIAEQQAGNDDYNEETFYNPDLEEIDDQAIDNFWSDTKLELAQHQPISPDLDLTASDQPLQPDFSPVMDLGDVMGPSFGLDLPISDLFPTVNIDQLLEPNPAELTHQPGSEIDLDQPITDGDQAIWDNLVESN
jgi:chemotaxis protein histidine kinase CheA